MEVFLKLLQTLNLHHGDRALLTLMLDNVTVHYV